MSDDHSVILGQRERGSTAIISTASTSTGGGGTGTGGSSGTKGFGEVKGGLAIIPMLGEIGAGGSRTGIRGSEGINDILGSNSRNLKCRKFEYPGSKTEASFTDGHSKCKLWLGSRHLVDEKSDSVPSTP